MHVCYVRWLLRVRGQSPGEMLVGMHNSSCPHMRVSPQPCHRQHGTAASTFLSPSLARLGWGIRALVSYLSQTHSQECTEKEQRWRTRRRVRSLDASDLGCEALRSLTLREGRRTGGCIDPSTAGYPAESCGSPTTTSTTARELGVWNGRSMSSAHILRLVESMSMMLASQPCEGRGWHTSGLLN